ncbi:Uncharacterized protein OS=Planctomyces limnophilus (strain ATCC 43296 / DSM 3776 / IFAM 1008 / 290) GN=Plim_0030 PE=4 SV=1: DUF164 [Gemmata massiliana]|uniref:CT398-like coiled coil hairpin domain-containing protein n=1 Tax=Gemmata massiliana TaxID=1210884 RepID=A0A6P2DAV4_9BACT|nr:hypothetical protein [Gemmata massiliana]VTR98083.1 Uncharacterized protein OS=Planctomyces limnophilus (strain ATCC 43296 / DSM 3776 / IFAM 1008 / 290) GN=Plim_0030 PE=4 SV=1: DUF164 [Gemmata massiliana]
MSSVTSALRECHRLRVHLRNLQAEIDRGPRVLRAHQDDLEAARQTHKDHHDSITKLKLKQREDEGTLKQTENRLAKLEDQLSGMGVQKEYDAKQSEITQAKTKKGELEDAILSTIMELEEKTGAVPVVEQAWAQAQADFKQFQVDAAERLEGMKADQEVCTADLARTEATLPPDVKKTYDNIVKTKGPDSFAAAKARVCQGCRTTMTEAQFTALRGGEFRTCNSCGRMQYPVE